MDPTRFWFFSCEEWARFVSSNHGIAVVKVVAYITRASGWMKGGKHYYCYHGTHVGSSFEWVSVIGKCSRALFSTQNVSDSEQNQEKIGERAVFT